MVKDHLSGFAAVCQDCLQQVVGPAVVEKKVPSLSAERWQPSYRQDDVTLPAERSAYKVAFCL